MTDRLADVQRLLGHHFADVDLLDEALTHPSAHVGGRGDRRPDYERLEFLGDRVLGLIIASTLYRTYPDADAGAFARRLNDMVRRETLAGVARELGLGDFINMAESERQNGGAEKPAILADVCEALIGALYIDGGLPTASAFVMARWQGRLDGQIKVPRDPKTELQEWAHARKIAPPDYRIVSRTGPDHEPVFVVRASLSVGAAEAVGTSRKKAESSAAAALLKQVTEDE